MKPSLLRVSRLSLPLATAIAALLAVQSTQAASQTWGANANTAWYTTTNWAGGAVPGLQGAAASNTDVATFTSAYTGTTPGINMGTASLNLGAISIDSTRTTATSIGNSSATAGVLRLYGATVNSVANVIVRNAGSGLLTLQATQTGTMGVALGNTTNNINIDGSGGITISSIISEINAGSGITKGGSGAGVLLLSGANSYTGLTTASTGTLQAGNALAFGTVAGGVSITSGAVVDLNGQAIGAEAFTLNGTGISSGGALINSSGTAASLSGTINLASNSSVGGNGAGIMTLSGIISGSGTFTKVGSGTVILSNSSNSYTTSTVVNAGTLIISGSIATGAGNVGVNNAGILQFGNGGATGTAASAGTIFVSNTGTVQINKSDLGTLTNAVASNPSATTTLSGANATGTTNTFTATSFSNGGAFATNSTTAGATLAFSGASGAIDLKGTNITVGGAGNTLFTSAGQGLYSSTTASNVTKAGTGTLIYQGNQGYTGTTAIDAGAVRVDIAQSNGSTYFVGNGGTLATAASLFLGGGTAGLTGGVTFDRAISVNSGNSGTRVIGGTNTSGTNTYSSTITLPHNNVTLQSATGGTVAFNTLTAAGLQTVTLGATGNTGTVQLGGIADNVNVAATVAFGTLELNKTSSASVHALGGLLTVNSGATAKLTGTGGDQIFDSASATVSSGGVLDLNGQNETVNVLTLSGTGISSGGVLINNNGATTSVLTASGGISLAAASSIGGSANISTSSAIGGSLGLTKIGAGTLTLSGSNGFTGGMTISAGTLLLGSTGALNSTAGSENAVAFGAATTGTLALAGNSVVISNLTGSAVGPVVTNANGSAVSNATLTVGNSTNASGTYAGILQNGTGGGTLALIKAGTGTLTLSGANTFSGGLTVKGGTTTATVAGALGTGTIFFDTGGAVNATVQTSSVGITSSNPITIVAGSTGTNTLSATTNSATWNGLITANENLTINHGNVNTFTVFAGGAAVANGKTITIQNGTTGTFNANGIVTGNGGVTTGGAGAGTINITGASSYTGGFTLGGSSTVVLATSSTGTDGSPTDGPLGAGSIASILGTGTIRAGTVGNVTIKNTLTLAGNVSTGPTIASEKSLIFTGPATLTGTRTFTTALGGTVAGTSLTFSGNIGESGGAQGITKAGAGTMILSGTNSYTGTTTVSAGVLRLDSAGALGSGNLSLTGGVLGLGSGNLSLTAGTGVGQYQLNGGGFAAYGGNRSVSIGGSTINWATGGLTGTLLLGAADSDSTITLTTSISQAGAARTIQVADGSAAIDAVLSGGTTSNAGGWTKTGTGTLALTGSNLYTGATLVSGGTLMLGNGTGNTGNLSTTASISVSSGATLSINRTGATNQATDLSGKVISGAGGFSQVGSGTTTLSAANSYTGTTTLSAGTFVLSVAESVNVSGPLGKQLANAAGTIVLSGGTLQYSSVNTNDYSGRFSTAASQAYNVNTNGQAVTWGTALISSGGTLTKSGAGTLNLTNASTFSGATTVSAGTLDLGGGTANGSLASTVLTLSGGSTFNYSRTGSTTQSFTTTNLASGILSITAASGNVLNLGTVVRTGGTIDFSSVGAGTVAASTASNVNGIIPGATFGNTWAVANGAGVAISGLADGSYTLTSAAGTSAAGYTGNNIDVDNSAGTLDGTITPSSLRFNSATSNILTLAAGSNVINSGILVTSAVGNNLSTISGGNLTSAASSDIIISQQNTSNGLTIDSAIVNNTSTGLIKLGAGVVTLGNSNTYSGATNVSAGTLILSAANTLSGATSVAGTATLQLGHATSMGGSTMTLASGATLQLRNDSNTTFTAPIAAATGAVTYNFDVNNAGSGSGKTLTLGNLTFATSAANTINVTGGNGYTLGLGTLSSPSGSGSFWNFTVNATTAAVTIAKFSAGSFGNALVLQGGNAITLTNFEMGSNGSNSLTVSGSGTVVTLGAASQTNNRAGGNATFTLTDGTLNINNALSISNPRLSGGPLAATLNLNGGTLDNTSAAAVTQTANPVQNWNGDFAFTGTKDLNLGTGAVSLGTATGTTRTITANGANLTIGGIISNGTTATGLTKAGVGTLILSNTNAYTGATTISGGTLQLDGSTHASSTVGIGTAGTLSGSGAVNGNATLTGSGTINKSAGSIVGTLSVTGGNWNGAGTITGLVTSSSGTFNIASGANLTATSGVSATGGTLTVNGTLTGTLIANSSTTVNGSGTITGDATIQGNHNPGNSPGIQSFGGNLTYSGGASAVNWELNADTTGNLANPNAIFDQVVVGGNLDFTDLTTLSLSFVAAGSSVLWSDTFWDTAQSWTLYDVTGTTTGFANLSLTTFDWLDSGSNAFNTARPDGSFSLSQIDNDIILNYTVVPEPNVAALLGGLGVLALLRRRRNA